VLDGGGDAPPSLVQVARRLRLSPRTLVRRLGARGTSFRDLVAEHRRRRAAELLLQPELSIGEIAERLGYRDPTNFARACRRWFGFSPRAYRARRGA
jgi:AraC-like DNA-binding protein